MTTTLVRLDEVADVRLGRQRSPKNHDGPHMRPYVRAANIGWKGLLLDDVKSMNFSDAEMTTYRLKPGDVLLNEASGSAHEVGKPAIWNGEITECAFQNTLIRVRPRGPESRFLYHYFRYLSETARFAVLSRGVGIHHLGRDTLAALEVPLPPIEEQRRIAGILDQADELRTKRRASLALLNSLTESIFLDTLSESEHDPGTVTCTVGEVADVQGGLQVTSKRASNPLEVPYLRVANVRRGRLDLSEVKTMRVTASEFERTRLLPDDVLVVEGHGNEDEIGRVARWTGAVAGCVHQNHLIRIRLDGSRADSWFVEAYLNSWLGRQALLRAARTTSGLNTISVGDVRAAPLRLPKTGLQKRFRSHVKGVLSASERGGADLAQLDALFAALQHKAFRGER